jgi:hypothetical protein
MNQAISKAVRASALGALAAVVAVLASTPSPARAGMDYDLRLGTYTDAGGLAVGGGFLTNMGSSYRWFFNPNVEAAFGDNVRVVTMNGDLHYDFTPHGPVSMYVGGGPAIVSVSPDGGDSQTDLGLNVFGGMTAVRGSARPFVQIKGIMADNTELALMGGIRF